MAVQLAMGDEENTGKPRVAQTVESILSAMGVESYDPRVVNQLLELLYRHVSSVLDDARVFSEHADKQCVNADDIKLAIRSRVNFAFTQPPPRDVTARLAAERNAIPLPDVDSKAGVALPAAEFQLTAQNYQVIVDPNRNPPPVQKAPRSPRAPPRSPRLSKSPRSPRIQKSPQNQKSPLPRKPAQFPKSPQMQKASQFQTPPQMQKAVPFQSSVAVQKPQQFQKAPVQSTPPQMQKPSQFLKSPQRQKSSPMQKSALTLKSPKSQKSPRVPKSPKKSPKRARTSSLTSPPKRQRINAASQMPPPPEVVDLDGPSADLHIARSPRQPGNRIQVKSPVGTSKMTHGPPRPIGSGEVITIPDDPIVPGSRGLSSAVSPRSRTVQQNPAHPKF